MTQLKILKEFEITKRADNVSDEEGEKLCVLNPWSEIEGWFSDYNFTRIIASVRTDISRDLGSFSSINGSAEIDLNTLINGDQIVNGYSWEDSRSMAAIATGSVGGVIFRAVKASNRTFKSDWSFTHEGLVFFRKYFYWKEIRLKFSAGAIVNKELLTKQLESRSIRIGEHVEETNSKPVDTLTPDNQLTTANNSIVTLTNEKNALDTKLKEKERENQKLNQVLPGLFDKDGKLDEKKLEEIKNLQNNQEKHTDKDLEKHAEADLKPADLSEDWEAQIAQAKEWADAFAGKSAEEVKGDIDSLNSDLENLKDQLNALQEGDGSTRALFEVPPKS